MDSDLIWRKCDDKDKAENLIIGAKNMELDPFLAAYQYQNLNQWLECSNYITKKLVKSTKIQTQQMKGSEAIAEYRQGQDEDLDHEMDQMIQELASNNETTIKHSKRKALPREEFDRRLKDLLTIDDKQGASRFVEEFETSEYTKTNRLRLRFTEIPLTPKEYYMRELPAHNPVVKNVTPSQVTQFYTNKSPVLSQVLRKQFKNTPLEILGEFQIAFIAFMIGQNLEAFEHWKNLFILTTHAKDGIEIELEHERKANTDINIEGQRLVTHRLLSDGQFFQALIRCLFGMFKEFPESFFYEVLSQGSFIVEGILSLVESVENYINKSPPHFNFLQQEQIDEIAQSFLKSQKITTSRVIALKKLLIDRFGFDIDQRSQEEEEGDDAPVIVQNPGFFFRFQGCCPCPRRSFQLDEVKNLE